LKEHVIEGTELVFAGGAIAGGFDWMIWCPFSPFPLSGISIDTSQCVRQKEE
jgi:hypothetical protein